VGEVDQLQDPVDERVAERDQRVDSTGREADQRDVEEILRRLDEVDPEPDTDQRSEDEPEDRQERRALPLSKCGEGAGAGFGRYATGVYGDGGGAFTPSVVSRES
jgi:hypothetical protein